MAMSTKARIGLYGGGTVLTSVLTNRLLFTPLDALALTQSRSDIIGVVAGATLLLYGLGRAEILDLKETVDLGGVDVKAGLEEGSALRKEVLWASEALFAATPNIRSCALVVDGEDRFRIGRFRDAKVRASVMEGGIVASALATGNRAYLADLKVVPGKELEFGYLPSNCQVRNRSSPNAHGEMTLPY